MLHRVVTASAGVAGPVGGLARQQRGYSTDPRPYLGCAVYVSEARDAALLAALERIARTAPGAALANLFVDAPYNRSNFTLVGRSVPALAAAATALAQAALAALDLRAHEATHPRLGTVDHVSVHPLHPTSTGDGAAAAAAAAAGGEAAAATGVDAAAALARRIAAQLGSGPQALPVYTYGWAHPQQRPLAAIRRELGYFSGAAGGSWHGALPPPPSAAAAAAAAEAAAAGTAPEAGLVLPVAPCFGPPAAPPRAGVCCAGAAPWVVNYNVILSTDDLLAVRSIARAVSERGGGLAGVQAMALRHGDGVEVACNLLGAPGASQEAVLASVRRLAGEQGMEVASAYRTNKAPEELIAAAAAAGL